MRICHELYGPCETAVAVKKGNCEVLIASCEGDDAVHIEGDAQRVLAALREVVIALDGRLKETL